MGVLGSSGLLLEQTGEEIVNAARVVAVRIVVRLEVSAIDAADPCLSRYPSATGKR